MITKRSIYVTETLSSDGKSYVYEVKLTCKPMVLPAAARDILKDSGQLNDLTGMFRELVCFKYEIKDHE